MGRVLSVPNPSRIATESGVIERAPDADRLVHGLTPGRPEMRLRGHVDGSLDRARVLARARAKETDHLEWGLLPGAPLGAGGLGRALTTSRVPRATQ